MKKNSSVRPEPLALTERCKVVGMAFAFGAVFTALFAILVMFAEPLHDVKKYPLDPTGWLVVRVDTGTVVREATMWDMVKAKYIRLLLLAMYVVVILFTLYVVALGLTGTRNGITRWLLKELSRKSFRGPD
jgi:hypothetical protein